MTINPDWLLKHFEQISEAPDAVPRLRRFILDLAVRGKLAEQDPKDEPASELLKKIEAEKERLTKGGELRKHHTEPLDEEEIAFTIPSAWSWTHLAQIGIINPQNDSEDNGEASFVPMRMIYAEYRQPSEHEIRPWGEIRRGFTHFADGDVGLAKITPCFENGKSTVFRNLTGGIGAGTTELHIVRPIFVVADYILIFLKSSHFIEAGIPKMTGTAGQKRVPKDYFAFSPFPLPPLAEQHRIVAKVDELMALCDELEAAQVKRERRRDRLVAATLHGLGRDRSPSGPIDSPKRPLGSPSRPLFSVDSKRPQSNEDGALGESALPGKTTLPGETALPSFFLNHLPRFTTRPDHIHQLRQTILNLAVRGKLVPQDPKNEPASVFLKYVDTEKKRLIMEGMIRKIKPIPAIQENEHAYEIPETWQWVRLGNLAISMTNGIYKPDSFYSNDGILCLRMYNIRDGRINFKSPKRILVDSTELETYELHPGDLLVNRVNSKELVGKAAVIPITTEKLIFESKNIRVRLVDSDCLPKYCNLLFQIAFYRNIIEGYSKQACGQATVSQPQLALLPVPLPPLVEQHRIVAKVDELMALCDELEVRLTTTAATRHQLLESSLKEVFSP